MANVDAQVLGHNASNYASTPRPQQAMINALAAGQAVTIGTDSSSNSNDTLPYGLYGSHAYAVIGYNASTGNFTLYNPWGFDQPGALSWSQLEATCDGFVVANTAGSAPISGDNLHAPVAAAALRISTAAGGAVTSPLAATNLVTNSAAWTTAPVRPPPPPPVRLHPAIPTKATWQRSSPRDPRQPIGRGKLQQPGGRRGRCRARRVERLYLTIARISSSLRIDEILTVDLDLGAGPR